MRCVGSVLTIYLGKPLIRLNYNQLDMEANFRSDLIHVRENSESIAMAHREGRFKARLNRRLDALTANFRRLIRINRNLGFFTNGYNYFIQIIPALIIAPMFIAGTKEFGVITQSTMAFATLARRVFADRDAVPIDLRVHRGHRAAAHAERCDRKDATHVAVHDRDGGVAGPGGV